MDKPMTPETTQARSGTIWKHYKGDEYRVLGEGRLEATDEPCVIYRKADNELSVIWVRSTADWFARVSEHIPHRFVEMSS